MTVRPFTSSALAIMILAFTPACGADEDEDDTSRADTGMTDTTMTDTTATDAGSDIGTGGDTYSCTTTISGVTGCGQLSGPGAAEAVAQDCGGNEAAGPCTLTNAIARCNWGETNGLTLVGVYYEADLDALEMACTGTFERL